MVHLDDPAVSHVQRNLDNVISNSSDKGSLIKFEENLATFQNQWAFDKCERNRSAILDELYENGREKTYDSSQCDASTTSLTVTPIINNDNNFYDNVTATKNTNKNSHLNYRYQKVYQDGTDKTGYFTNTFFINTIKENEQCSGNYSNNNSNSSNKNIELKEKLKYKQNQQRHVNNMGSNVSRNTAKGLSGRRAQSSGDLTNGNVNKSNNEREHQIAIEAQANDPNLMNDKDQVDTLCPTPDISQLMNVKRSERNKFFGSLPNHLDSDETYRENIYNKSNTQETQKRPFEKNKLECDSIQYPSSSPRVCGQTSHHQNAKSSTSNGIETTMHLKLAINRSNVDVGYDQGYGSERSPEEELPPILSIPYQSIDAQARPHYHQKPQWNNGTISESDFSFITKDCCFTVQVMKNERGLGISVYGGVDSAPNVAFRGLIRIKRLFPNQAAWSTGMLQPGDILLEANNTSLTGLTNHEALEVLRTAPNLVILSVCRPHDEQFRKLSPPADPPRPPQRSLHTTTTFEPQSPTIQTAFIGEFEITMVKQQGSLGFTLRKEDESVLGHYVRALIRDPAASDGRIKPGDKIVAVNDVPLCPMTHEEAVIFLRQANDRVKLRLYRDNSQTPIASISPSTSEQYISNAGKPKASLRPEAMNLLIDLAHKNRKQSCDSYSTGSSVQSSSASPTTWRLRRNNNNNNINKVNSNDNNAESYSENEKSASKSFDYQNQTYTVTMQSSSVCSDSETSTISQGSFINKALKQAPQCDNRVMNGTFTVDQFKQPPPQQLPLQQRPCGEDSEYYNEEELWRLMDVDEYGTAEHPDRPSHLDIGGSSGCTPVVSRKPMFQFSAANGYELNNLDNEALDAPVYNSMCNNPNLNNQPYQDGINNDFTSLPCETFLMSSRVNSNCATDDDDQFAYKNPMYQSAHVQVKSKPIVNDEDIYHVEHSEEGSKNLLKWKGVMFGIDEGDKTMAAVNVQTPETTTSSEPDSSCATMIEINPIAADNAKDINPLNRITFDDTTHEIITVELSRGWNSRLGFSLRNEPNSMQTTISAIYNDSVAAKDGRLRVGDQILMVNDESVEGMTTGDIIDLLRIIRGSIVLVVKRPRY
ncbi:uncharacterized protein LOC129579051 isoform X4 [Sitodiplosis mosellana]|uniref:uncharacterized protein LOC129579051 isoform X4 n=1 Tax=Sitodiplosis mosellana TaxID=263140 RepID=UPI0024450DD0|nr:uncharacterized protein LOC129579051 isoform X4 [Sitodiplosis mosellana]XP_055324529.1 uncharacterized protein LOC129579051 isoform X4 [Sitodiplosis mosellana]XP_055324530.1 uncharacterized protein LOC129579051 isoform X4 [Sitodiplosis mosellana]XP_055324531.1 uncharacterized protein LOC129579051 isoform X4 [Sitodiplosis mosellana]XP_055324532.1 uncharacterized protein LOC129579051 isoform X4 [Sitodiplosis mosellana]XP_055324533.1 uncharacterized protein LOC129579051 isoform X4 [Sitodiplosi